MKTLSDIFFHPNPILLYEISGQEIIAMLQMSLALRNEDKKEGHGDFLQLSGIEVSVHRTGEIDVFTVNCFDERARVQADKTYSVATTDYVSNSAYRQFFQRPPVRQLSKDIKERVEHALREIPDTFLSFHVSETERWKWF